MNEQKNISNGKNSNKEKFYSHMKVNSTFWGLMVESGVGMA